MSETRKAVVSYAVGASDKEKMRALLEGLRDVAAELVELGVTPLQLASELESIADDAEQGELT